VSSRVGDLPADEDVAARAFAPSAVTSAADTSAAPGQPVLVRLAGRVRPLMPRAGQGEMPISWMIPWAGDGISGPAVSVATSTGITPCVLVA
jgi:hypothetical protein